jgi:hypothetical protein
MYHLILRFSSADEATLKNKILTPAMLDQRKKLHAAVTSSNKQRLMTFKAFLQVMLVLKTKEGGFMSKYKGLVGVMSGLEEFSPTRAYFVQVLDKYILDKAAAAAAAV